MPDADHIGAIVLGIVSVGWIIVGVVNELREGR